MGSRKCGGCLSCLLIPLALWSIIVNILLYFPNGQVSYAASNKLTNYVWYFEGICFSGVMMLMVAVVLLVLDNESRYKCCQSENCTKKYMGPYCRTLDGWEYAFEDTSGRFLTDSSMWSQCLEPTHVVEWNVILFSILIALSGLQVIVCLVRISIQLSKILCGTYSVIIQPGII
ncbi:transmembrane 4 L6 family member 18 isoform X2 [Marmota marmota marmota]|uniref:transmembrane 4 L6 family member 18 isoform X2 n=1 Tax=Marmota marmota marmota TaxID=9994 RepID=UPI002092FDDB|nr:transmembrane 4 L6 family member 18 isoform X2 [Marmota marmota marmota]